MSSEEEKEFYEALRHARSHKEHLGFNDFVPGFNATVEIEKTFQKKDVVGIGGNVHKVVTFLKFKGKEKILWMNETKLHAMSKIHGKKVVDWTGKKIVIYADPTVKVRGRLVGGLVIKEAK